MRKKTAALLLAFAFLFQCQLFAADSTQFIRINQLGYAPQSPKIAVWGSVGGEKITTFELINTASQKVVYTNTTGKAFGKYGPFSSTYRLDFSAYKQRGTYYIKAGKAISPSFKIEDDVYKGAADFCLRYMRQQRSGFNPFLKDSCHTHDGYTLYAPVPDSTHIDVAGGWHDASDYLQYSTTTANATYHLLAAYRDFPNVFGDIKQANGLDGKNGTADVLDEAKWGLQWLLKMHPKDDWMFNQLGDDRDHKGMRIPKEDTNYYKRGFERPVYFCTGEPQVRGKFMNATTGVASTAGKFASAFSLGSSLFYKSDNAFAQTLYQKSSSSFILGLKKPGACQTASVLSPYIYAEDNWKDDIELAAAATYVNDNFWSEKSKTEEHVRRPSADRALLDLGYKYANEEPITPWLGKDTAKHYQWYPFINVGHYELAKALKGKQRDTIISYYKKGIDLVWQKSKQNAFYRGIPFIWCSNNLTVSFAMQCYWYRELTGDKTYYQLEQACFDWIFGTNPWGTSMVYGLPSWGDTPVDPHSAFTHLKNYPIDGGLVDGPVYTNIYKNLIGIKLHDADEYALFQSDLAVYHDDYGDYSTNEPTMDGTASLVYLLAAKEAEAVKQGKHQTKVQGGIIRGDSTQKKIALVFTADEFGDGLQTISKTLQQQNVHGSFFFTGRFYRNEKFQSYIKQLYKQGNYFGPHSNEHLLYCDWKKRDSLLVTHEQFKDDLRKNYEAINDLGIQMPKKYFIPPYEWWNDSIAKWSAAEEATLFCFTPGTRSNADYTWPEMGASYKSTEQILTSIKSYEEQYSLKGNILLVHAGTDPRRQDKLYDKLSALITDLKKKGYTFVRIDELLQ